MWIALYLGWIIRLDYCETLDSWDWESLELSCGPGACRTGAIGTWGSGFPGSGEPLHLIPSNCASLMLGLRMRPQILYCTSCLFPTRKLSKGSGRLKPHVPCDLITSLNLWPLLLVGQHLINGSWPYSGRNVLVIACEWVDWFVAFHVFNKFDISVEVGALLIIHVLSLIAD